MPLDHFTGLQVVPVNQSNMPQAQSIFFHAYQNNPLLRYFLNATRNGFEQRLRGFIRAQLVSHYHGNNRALAIADGQRLVGAVMINKTTKPDDLSWSWRLAMYSVAGVYYTEQLRSYYQDIAKATAEANYHWLSLVGLHPDYQHQGYGQILMNAAVEDCHADEDFPGLCIDACNKEQQHFFASLGYLNIAEIALPRLDINLMFLGNHTADC